MTGKIGDQAAIVMVHTTMSPALIRSNSPGERITRTVPVARPGEAGSPLIPSPASGSICATPIEFATDQMGPLRIGPATDVKGLFLCGASTPSGHGISNVMWSGVRAASEVLETDVGRRVLAGDRFGDSSVLPPLRDDWDAWRESH